MKKSATGLLHGLVESFATARLAAAVSVAAASSPCSHSLPGLCSHTLHSSNVVTAAAGRDFKVQWCRRTISVAATSFGSPISCELTANRAVTKMQPASVWVRVVATGCMPQRESRESTQGVNGRGNCRGGTGRPRFFPIRIGGASRDANANNKV